ncbi:hypothetical protein [Pararhizobium sp.]|uniref:hypothetical protein n=1 Tax=Pararhizobium sp. TaxID=1977563 RepID=UPI002727A49C|nr:hypothetical protein [Pararhizobium sp.]MDO9416103.1 hypothetical protein [Pararhizobium sp.]
MAFDPLILLAEYADTPCSVQFWIADTPSVELPSLRAAVAYAAKNGAMTQSADITVHLPREDIVYGTEKVRLLVQAIGKG